MTSLTGPTTVDLTAIALSVDDDQRLRALFTRGTPENTQRAYRVDYGYLRAWRLLRFETDMTWPEDPAVAMAYLLDHSEDLSALPTTHPARRAAETMIAAGVRKSLAAPAPSTNARRIASWKVFHNAGFVPTKVRVATWDFTQRAVIVVISAVLHHLKIKQLLTPEFRGCVSA